MDFVDIIEKLRKIHPDLESVRISATDYTMDLVFENGTFMCAEEFGEDSATSRLMWKIESLLYPATRGEE